VNISWHADAAALGSIIPFDIHAHQFIPCHVDLYTLVLLEKIEEVVEVFNSKVFNAKVVSNQAKLDGTPFVAPKSWHGGSFIVAFRNKVQLKKIVGKDAGLEKTVTALANFEVNLTSTVLTQDVVFQVKFVWDTGNIDMDIFRIGHGCVQVEVLEIDCAEVSTFSGKDTV
jgi:hypothetical protein